MPFGCALAKNPLWICIYCLLIAHCSEGMSAPVAVKVGDSAIIPCQKTCNGVASWALTTKNEKVDVLQCAQGSCKEGVSFTKRVKLLEKINPGDLSITLYPVLYNDEGWYDVNCDSAIICTFHLEVFVPTAVNASVRGNVTLPCYARTQKQIADEAVNILWKKEDQTVFQIQNGIPEYGATFTGRASVSLQRYKDGDLSLTLLNVTTSDKGLYRCYHNKEEDHGYPGAVTLNVAAHQTFWEKSVGDNLTLDLFGFDPVTVNFTGPDAAESHVCTVKENKCTCSPDYTNRVAVVNDLLQLSGLTISDSGTFTVKDSEGQVISVNTVTVKGWTRKRLYIFLFVFGVFICVCAGLFLNYRYHRMRQAHLAPCIYYATQQNEINEEQLREPATIGLSQQETSPEPEVHLQVAVEETMPERTSEKQDNTGQDGCIPLKE